MRRIAPLLVLGVTALLLAGAGGASSGTAAVDAPGNVKWRFQVSGQYVVLRPAVGLAFGVGGRESPMRTAP